jgi:hypothetical protein
MPLPLGTVQAWGVFMARVADRSLPAGASLPRGSYPRVPGGPAAAALDGGISAFEVESHLPRLRNGRAGGVWGLPAELFKYAQVSPEPDAPPSPHLLSPLLSALFSSLLRGGVLPPSVNRSLVAPIFKRGDAHNTANYRPIAVAEPVLRLYASILNSRLLKYTEGEGLRAPTQAGFRPGLSVNHQLFALTHLRDWQRARGCELYVCFLDLEGAYDRVSRPLLWKVLRRLGVGPTFLGAVRRLYRTASVAIRILGRCGPALPSRTGVRQGCPLSPTLFGLVMDGMHRHLQAIARSYGVATTSGMVTDLTYADDCCLLSPTVGGLQHLINGASLWCAAAGMRISVAKTVCMTLVGPMGGSWTLDGTPLPTPDTAKYLGLQITAVGDVTPALEHVRRQFAAAFAVVRRQYGRLECTEHVWLFLQLVRACVLPVACVGAEIWGVLPLSRVDARARARLASTHISQLRLCAGLRRSVASDIVLTELGVEPLPDLWILRAVGLYNALLAAGPFHRGLLQDAAVIAAGGRCWLGGLRRALRELGYPLPPVAGPLLPVSPEAVVALQRAAVAQRWAAQSPCPRTAPRRGARLCTYARWFLDPALRRGGVLRLPVSPAVMRSFLRFRTGCHGLPRDVGSRGRGAAHVPRPLRLCRLCQGGPGDEQHLVFECLALQDLRDTVAHLFVDRVSVRDFVWQPDLAAVALFVHRCLRRVRDFVA